MVTGSCLFYRLFNLLIKSLLVDHTFERKFCSDHFMPHGESQAEASIMNFAGSSLQQNINFPTAQQWTQHALE